jgi:hypothetical protein
LPPGGSARADGCRWQTDGTALALLIPALLSRPWLIPLAETTLVNGVMPEYVLPLAATVPRLVTVSPGVTDVAPNVLLVFSRPQRFPAFSARYGGSLPFSMKRASEGSVWVDAVWLTARDDTLVTMLVDNGVATAPTIEHACAAASGTYGAPTVASVQAQRVCGSELTAPGPHWYDQKPVGQAPPAARPTTSPVPETATASSAQPAASAPASRSALWTVLCGFIAAVFAALAWAIFTDLTNHLFRVAGLVVGMIVGYVIRGSAPRRGVTKTLAVTAAVLSFASIVLGWILVTTVAVAHVNNLGFLTAFDTIGDTVGGWTEALPFHDPWAWGVLALATVEGYYIALLPRGADSSWAFQPMQAAPGVMPMEPPSSPRPQSSSPTDHESS